MVPLCWALRAAGHEVRVASGPALMDAVVGSGVTGVAVGADVDHVAMRAEQARSAAGAQNPRERIRDVFAGFLVHSEAMIADLHAFARAWRPDIVLFDPTTYAGPIVAAALGIPSVRVLHGFDVTYRARAVVRELAGELADRYGVPDVDLLGDATLDPCPPSIQCRAEVERIVMRYLPYNGSAVLPEWLRRPASRPRVCVTWGKTVSRVASAPFGPGRVLAALADQDVEVVLCVSDAERDECGPLPQNVRVASGLSLNLLLGSCSAIVHHGGQGTTLTAAYHATPQLVLPQLPDQQMHLRQLAPSGVTNSPDRVEDATPELIGDRVRALLDEPEFGEAARRLRSEMLAQPSPARVVRDVAELAAAAS
jgi:UDP:flavonoid glycosyltransferase YjiC (YdhE family)